jgi:hypothetical protein
MVMERMKGVPISQVERLREAGVDIPKLARDGVTIFFTQVFRDGFFHADMHPGNIMVSLEPDLRALYLAGLRHRRHADRVRQGISGAELPGLLPPRLQARGRAAHRKRLGAATTRVDELEAAIRAVCEPYFDRPLAEISLGMVLMRLFQTSRRFQVEIQPQLVLLQKTLLNIEGLGRQLDPNLDLWSTAKPFLENGCWTRWGRSACGMSCRPRRRATPRSCPTAAPAAPVSAAGPPRQPAPCKELLAAAESAPTVCCRPSSAAASALCWAWWCCILLVRIRFLNLPFKECQRAALMVIATCL